MLINLRVISNYIIFNYSMGNSLMSVSVSETETEPERETNRTIVTLPRRSQRTIEIPLRRTHTISREYSYSHNKSLTCILCNKTLNISNTEHLCEIRPSVEEFLIKFT